MAKHLFLLTLLCLQSLSIHSEEDSPLADIASAFLENLSEGDNNGGGGLGALGGILGSLMQGDNAQNLGAMFGQGGNNVGDMLSGLSSLLTDGKGNINQNLVGSMVSMLAQQGGEQPAAGSASSKQKRSQGSDDLDLSGLLSAAGSLFQGQNAATFLPVLMNTLSAFSGPQAEERAHQHHDHAWFLPPVLEKVHVYWDHFLNSELGRAIWKQSGLQKAMKTFEGADGKVDFEKVLKSLENHSFRRLWIKRATAYLTQYAVHLANPEVQQRYLSTAQFLVNGFLKSHGYPPQTMFNPARAAESVSALANYIAKKYLDLDGDLSVYVKPAFKQVQQILKMAQTTGQSLLSQTNHDALTDRLTDTLNLEVIEPVLRVYRAYRHSVISPHCREHLMCLVNQHQGAKQDLPGFKVALTKVSSLVASAALSYRSGQGFWELYNAIQEDVNCESKYPADCSAFHEHEQKVTTEYYHSEL